jgi:hypothetical protein
MDPNYWRKCIVCKKDIHFLTKYYKCSVSSCDKKRSPAQFCTVDCWDVHRSIMSHKSAGADEYQSPSKSKWIEEQASEPKIRIVKAQNLNEVSVAGDFNEEDVLVVVSKLKAYVKDSSGMNTSADVMSELSSIIRQVCNDAVKKANHAGRKTLMARDFK